MIHLYIAHVKEGYRFLGQYVVRGLTSPAWDDVLWTCCIMVPCALLIPVIAVHFTFDDRSY